MKKRQREYEPFERIEAGPAEGLSAAQASLREERGACNLPPQRLTRTAGQIIRDNIFTLFNIINLVLAALIISVGSYRNTLFLGVAISTTLISIIQELRAKRNIDKLADISEAPITVIRDGGEITLRQDELVLDDIFVTDTGSQICADGTVLLSFGLEVDESSLTGESEWVRKAAGDKIYSGSFVVSGSARVRAEAVGDERYSSRLTHNARREKKPDSELMRSIGSIIKALTAYIIPVGILMFCLKYYVVADASFKDAVLGTAAAMIGMIPEGLVLLTGIAFAVGSINLSRARTLVQSPPCIETLARVDVLCLDKTGTITYGARNVREIVASFGHSEAEVKLAASSVVWALNDDNSTAIALKSAFPEHPGFRAVGLSHFSSARRWSGAQFEGRGSYIIGAPEFVFPNRPDELFGIIEKYTVQGDRVLVLAHSEAALKPAILPEGLETMALLILSESIRPEAHDTFAFFREEGVAIKVISGDNPVTVSGVAARARIEGAERYIDMSMVGDDAPLDDIARVHTVFGRVSPMQKQRLVETLRLAGHIVAMVGDGVNDVPALKEANCSIAMASGSEAARNVSDLVLLDSNFEAMVSIVREGRRVVNNIGRVASLYLIKTIYSSVLSLLFLFIWLPYPFVPIQLTPISALTVGIPSFFLALRPNYQRLGGRFINVVFGTALPAALCVLLNLILIQAAGAVLNFTYAQTSTIGVLLTGTVGFVALIQACLPLDFKKGMMLALTAAAFICVFTLFGAFFSLSPLPGRCAFVYMPLLAAAYPVFACIRRLLKKSGGFIIKITEYISSRSCQK